MLIQDDGNVSCSSTLVTGSNGNSLDSEESYVPKSRKPYTITKQRERWTGEEHQKFLEALKLYGRAWGKIVEHVGTKTAIQIRSHAQKFFSKVARESNNSNSAESVEIPPPRPKRKPTNPYPRKLMLAKKGTSLNSSFDQENQSPTSVLSAVCSDILGSEDSNTFYDPSMQENISESEEPVSVKMEEGSFEATTTKSLRLFGKTLFVMDVDIASVTKPCFFS